MSNEPEVGLEPTATRLQGGCSDQLSYSGDAAMVGAVPRAASRPALRALPTPR